MANLHSVRAKVRVRDKDKVVPKDLESLKYRYKATWRTHSK